MPGFLIGLVGGILELMLLGPLAAAVQEGNSGRVAFLFLLKALVLIAAFAPVVIFLRHSLAWCGAGMAATLIAGAFLRFLIPADKSNKQGEGDKK